MPEQLNNPEKMEKKLPARAYYVSSPEDNTVLVALDVKISGNTIRWFDSVKERAMNIGQIVAESPDSLTFQRAQQEGGATYTFEPLNLDIYRQKVKDKLLSGRECENEEQMLEALEKTRLNAW